MSIIAARKAYIPPQLGKEYNRDEIRGALGLLAQSVPPQITRTVGAATTATTADGTIVGDTTGGDFAVTLPLAAQVQFMAVTIINIGSGTLTVTGTVSGSANPTLAQWKSMTVQSDGVRWFKIASV